MPLSRRRRRKPVSARPVQQKTTPLHPPGQSPLEKLPVEIFNQIFCESQNVEFVLTSKSIYARLAYPSEWLVVEFFQCYGDDESKVSCLAQAIHTKCFSVPVLIKWLNRYGAPAQHPDIQTEIQTSMQRNSDFPDFWKLLRVAYVPKRWLEPENVDLLIPLLRDMNIAFPFDVSDNRIAGFEDAMFFASNPVVPFRWIIELREQQRFIIKYFSIGHGKSTEDMLMNLLTAYKFLSHVMKRPNITKEELNFLSPPDFHIAPESPLARQAFNSNLVEVVSWAIGRGLAPTNQQLTTFANNGETFGETTVFPF